MSPPDEHRPPAGRGRADEDRPSTQGRRPATGSGRHTRRTDPLGKEALFTAPVAAAADQIAAGDAHEGRTALFSSGPARPGSVLVSCSRCRGRTRVSLIDLGFRLATGSAWWPLRHHAHWMRCPSCGRRTWCALDWTG